MNAVRARFLAVTAALLAAGGPAFAQREPSAAPPRFANGPPTDPAWFPIGVWLQAPANAKRYADLGINLYVGLWQGPTKTQLDELAAAGMRVVCTQNDVALAYDKPIVVGWMHGDEPDNAQGRRLTGYAPPIEPWRVVEAYERMHRADPTRPVLLNLGQGAAWDGWHGRGERTGHAEDYREYVKGCDLVSFDIYPVTHTHRDVRGRLEFTGFGVRRLRDAAGDGKPVWAVLETARVADGKGDGRPTPAQIRAEAWIAICCGASGIVWFAHEFAPEFTEAGLLKYPEIVDAVRTIGREVAANAPVLATPPLTGVVTATTLPAVDIALRVHRHGGALHLFAASLAPTATRAVFRVPTAKAGSKALAADGRELPLVDGAFADDVAGYESRHYRVPE